MRPLVFIHRFAMPWKVVSPLLHPNTRKKVNIQSVGTFGALWEAIDESSLPPIYGGTGTTRS